MKINNELERKLQRIIAEEKFTDHKFLKTLPLEEFKALGHMVALNFLISQSAKYRGKVLDINIFMEFILTQFLSKYFVEDESSKRELLHAFVFDRMILSNKISLFRKIIKMKHQEIWKEYKDNLKQLVELNDFRNNIAHSLLDTSENSIEELRGTLDPTYIKLVYYKDGEFKNEKITKEQIDVYYDECYKMCITIKEIESKILGEIRTK